jgi:DNA repair photolyase
MKTVYQTTGKAREYCEQAVNLYAGCSHGCIYCYAPNATYKTRDIFNNPQPRKDIIKNLSIDCLKTTDKTKPVLLCFTCDPYQPLDQEFKLSRMAIEVLHSYGFPVMVLTKGGKRGERDFDLLSSNDQFGVTLTCIDNAESLKWEPGAALPQERVDSLKKAHDMGIKTWVSLEPVLNPETALEIIRQTHSFVDKFKVGLLNYHPLAKTIDWIKFRNDVTNLFQELNCNYYIKNDLKNYVKR